MCERQLTHSPAYGKCSINVSSYNDGGDKEEEGIMKDYGDEVFTSVPPSHLKKNKNNSICPPEL